MPFLPHQIGQSENLKEVFIEKFITETFYEKKIHIDKSNYLYVQKRIARYWVYHGWVYQNNHKKLSHLKSLSLDKNKHVYKS